MGRQLQVTAGSLLPGYSNEINDLIIILLVTAMNKSLIYSMVAVHRMHASFAEKL